MNRLNRDETAGSGQHASRRERHWVYLAATLLGCVSCSSQPLTSDEGAAVDGVSESLRAGPRPRDCGRQHRAHPDCGGPAHGGPSSGCDHPHHGHAAGKHCPTEGPGAEAGAAGSAGAADTGGAAGTADAGGAGSTGGSTEAGGAASTGGSQPAAGAAGFGGEQPASFTLSTSVMILSPCPIPQTVTITNTADVPLTWQVRGDLTGLVITPLGSTLAAGAAIALSVVQKPGASSPAVLSIDADVGGSRSLQIAPASPGVQVQVPADIDLGNVPVGTASPTVFIPVPQYTGMWSGAGLMFYGGDTSAFEKSGVAPRLQPGGMGWTLYVRGWAPGPVQATLLFFSMTGTTVCAPNSFSARAVIVAQ